MITKPEKIGSWIAIILGVLAITGIVVGPVVMAFETVYATNDSVDTKIHTAAGEIKALLEGYRKDDTEMWINYLNSKANRNQADDSDMVLLSAKLRQREDLLASKPK